MRFLRYIFVPWTIILVYTFFSGFLGQNGLYAKKHLEAERTRLTEHEEILKNANMGFQRTKDNLKNDPDALSVYARQFGYGITNEKFVRIKGLSVAMHNKVSTDKVLYAEDPAFVSDKAIKIISALFGLAILVFFLINDIDIIKSLFSSR